MWLAKASPARFCGGGPSPQFLGSASPTAVSRYRPTTAPVSSFKRQPGLSNLDMDREVFPFWNRFKERGARCYWFPSSPSPCFFLIPGRSERGKGIATARPTPWNLSELDFSPALHVEALRANTLACRSGLPDRIRVAVRRRSAIFSVPFFLF